MHDRNEGAKGGLESNTNAWNVEMCSWKGGMTMMIPGFVYVVILILPLVEVEN